MRKFLKASFLTAGLFFTVQIFAQDLIKGNPGMYPSYVAFKAAPPAFTNGKIILSDENGKLSNASNVLLKSKEQDNIGQDHYRYQQTYNGIAVENAVYILHVKAGKIQSQNGDWVKDFPSTLKSTATISTSAAIHKATDFVGARSYKWQLPSEEAFIKREQNNPSATFYPKAQLVYYSGEDAINPSALRLAYKLDIYAQYPMSRQIVYVDAANGNILGKRELIHTTNATGSAVTAYSGTQTITTDYTGTTYRLRETGRGNGINTYNMKTAGTSYAAAVDFTDADNVWNNVNANKDQYATDGHWGTEKTYDYYFTKFNRNSVDNAGFALNSYIHTNLVAFGYPDNVNAFWDGSRMTYGDGNTTYSPLTALDICGHEITHGVTERTSNLTYSNQSGALNEGFSDIFGTAIEFYAKGTSGNWLIGENIGASFRSMSNPNTYSQPDTYLGTYWYTGTADNGGVHTNSGVLNFWFYILSQGGSGTNDIGSAYTVTGIGIDKAAAIAFRTNTVYLTASSNYAAARTYAIQSATDLYGAGSAEVIATTNAWYAVGVGAAYNTGCGVPSALTSSAITSSGATLSWTAGSNAVSYLVEYKTSAATTWTVAASATTATSVSLTGLTASTAYNWRVTTNCSSSTSTAATANFTTTAVATGCAVAFEPNETQATAIAITSGVTNSAAISSTTDIDYYKIVTTATSSNVYNLVGPSGVDFDLYIYNSAGTQIGSGTGSTATETVSLTSQAASTYYIKVIGYNGANSATCYTIKATATAATTCAAPTALTSSAITSTGATVGWTAASGAVSYKVEYKTSAATTWTVAASATTATSVTLTGLTASTAYNWRVTTNCSASASTAVSANFTTLAATGCQSSLDNATNGTISGAAVIPFNTNVTGLISPSGDNDYYKFVITTGGTATVTLTTLPADYDLTIVNSAGTQLAISQNGSTTSETITRTYTAGTYYARVFGYNNANNASVCYTLKVQLGTASLTGTNTPEITQNGLLKIYPNPVIDFVTVSVLGNVDKQSVINVVDVNGRVVMTSKMINNLQRVDVSSLPKGVYMLQVNTATGKLSSKFVKQ